MSREALEGAWEALYSEFQCIMGNGHMEPPTPWLTDRQTRMKTLPYRNFVGGREIFNYTYGKFLNMSTFSVSS